MGVYYLTVAYDEPQELLPHLVSPQSGADLISKYGLFLVSSPKLSLGRSTDCNCEKHWVKENEFNRWNKMWSKVFWPQAVLGFVFELNDEMNPFIVFDIVNLLGTCLHLDHLSIRQESNFVLTPNVRSIAVVLTSNNHTSIPVVEDVDDEVVKEKTVKIRKRTKRFC